MQTASPRGPRAWLPSLLDFLPAAILAWLFWLRPDGWATLLNDGDTGWHIRTGEWIWQNRQVPHQDLFSFTRPGENWYAWEWLADLIFAGIHHIGGLGLLCFFSATIIVLAYTQTLLLMSHWGASPLAILPAFLLAIGSSTVHFLARPHIFTLLFFALSVRLLSLQLERPSRSLWWLVPMTMLWTNLHGGWPAIFTLLLPYVAYQAWHKGSVPHQELLVSVACALATLVNPYGWALHSHVFGYLQSDWIKASVDEFQSPVFRGESILQYELLLLISVISVGMMAIKKRYFWLVAVWLLVWSHFSLSAVRHIPLFTLLAAPAASVGISYLFGAAWERRSKTSVLGIFRALSEDLVPQFRQFSPWAVGLCILIGIASQTNWPHDFPASRFPVAFRSSMGEEIQGRRIFTTDQWGDYWIYHSWPKSKVYMDGRSDFYGPELGRRALSLAQADVGWQAELERWGIQYVLLPKGLPLAKALGDQHWELLYQDELAVLWRSREWHATLARPPQGKYPAKANGSPGIDRIHRGEDPMAFCNQPSPSRHRNMPAAIASINEGHTAVQSQTNRLAVCQSFSTGLAATRILAFSAGE
ncbi:MAG: hypothetical protein NW208_09640 [Bryobacter sp.]|nr:hypothetical protein [Bryobacter sp.]